MIQRRLQNGGHFTWDMCLRFGTSFCWLDIVENAL